MLPTICCIQRSNVHNLTSIINREVDQLYTVFSVIKLSWIMVFGNRKINGIIDMKINNNQIKSC